MFGASWSPKFVNRIDGFPLPKVGFLPFKGPLLITAPLRVGRVFSVVPVPTPFSLEGDGSLAWRPSSLGKLRFFWKGSWKLNLDGGICLCKRSQHGLKFCTCHFFITCSHDWCVKFLFLSNIISVLIPKSTHIFPFKNWDNASPLELCICLATCIFCDYVVWVGYSAVKVAGLQFWSLSQVTDSFWEFPRIVDHQPYCNHQWTLDW